VKPSFRSTSIESSKVLVGKTKLIASNENSNVAAVVDGMNSQPALQRFMGTVHHPPMAGRGTTPPMAGC